MRIRKTLVALVSIIAISFALMSGAAFAKSKLYRGNFDHDNSPVSLRFDGSKAVVTYAGRQYVRPVKNKSKFSLKILGHTVFVSKRGGGYAMEIRRGGLRSYAALK